MWRTVRLFCYSEPINLSNKSIIKVHSCVLKQSLLVLGCPLARPFLPKWAFGHACIRRDFMLYSNGVKLRISGGLRCRVAVQSAPTCIGFCSGGECASCGSSGLPWPWWLCPWPHAARCSRRGLGGRRGTSLSPLRSCRTGWSRFVSHIKNKRSCRTPQLKSTHKCIYSLNIYQPSNVCN